MTGDTFFDAHQRATIAAAMARMIPTDDAPGAAEAGTIDFLERYLSGPGYVYASPDGSGFEALTGRRLAAWTRRLELIRERYVAGVRALDAAARKRGADFVSLDADARDDVLRELERPEGRSQEADLARSRVTLYGAPVETALQQTNAELDLGFIPLLALHTRQGFYADPVYGGNRDHIGWQVIGFPGPASLAEVHQGRYTTIDYFAENPVHPGTED
ncbi:gluconate 2-dehydrogenase subunit 3 family protein [Blastococcus brunescens]|uniref:Gluconate 2-dehydrogenase subunit 3 family protein n=1 Tax=Blastococcus brunescens TaxID=1564165 RepID=A0ABZ1ATN3_9ACTN|nr:gluconate 2-dehydrogenase subunit 3 family protein [Blastococcus sp. BMG 8361]WRL61933.1 gluconate 2-dehydrogenase subunit 3 family protein [Blastococcus sp. BMG 8361]